MLRLFMHKFTSKAAIRYTAVHYLSGSNSLCRAALQTFKELEAHKDYEELV